MLVANATDDDGPDRDTWCTELRVAVAIGPWDLDPCSNARSHVVAATKFDLDGNPRRDGLKLARFVHRRTRAFVNPPYSRGNVLAFVLAYLHTRFCFLVRLDPSTEWFSVLFARAELVLIPKDRLAFEPPPGVEGGSNPYPHALVYADERDATPEILAMCYVLRPKRNA